MFMMIVCLWVMYGVCFSIAGVKNAFFFAVLCGLLEIVPFVGNLAGTLLTLSMSLVQDFGRWYFSNLCYCTIHSNLSS